MHMSETKYDIYTKLNKFFNETYGIKLSDVDSRNLDGNLLGDLYGLAARDLLYLYFYIEKEFEIYIPGQDIAEGKFCSVNGIIDIISSQIDKKSSANIA